MIAGLETPNSGDIYIDGQRVNDAGGKNEASDLFFRTTHCSAI